MDALQQDQHYTFADLLTWDDDDEYWELIDGVPYLMASPIRVHQSICGEIFRQLANFLTGKPCRVYSALGVRLNADEGDDTFLIPDISVVCDDAKLDKYGCRGAPDMVVEILSPSTSARDRWIKFNQYLQAGVREYWIVDPDSRTLSVHVLENGKYVTTAYGDTGTVSVRVLDGCVISLPDVFSE